MGNMYLIISNDDNNVMSIYTNYIYYYMLEEQKKNDGMKIRMRIEHTIKKKNLPIFIQKIDARKRRSLIQPNNQTERRIVLTTTRQQTACKTTGRDYTQPNTSIAIRNIFISQDHHTFAAIPPHVMM